MGSNQDHHTKLGEFFATSICGNDILSSVLYVSGIAAVFTGVFAPVVLLLVVGVLYLYKAVYTEAVEALPVNGGAYNCLLNASSKMFASVAGVMTILSYIATAVISAKVAIEYLHSIVSVPVIPATIVLLLVFALLVISGMKDSAKVASGIFIFHLITLATFIVFGILYFLNNGIGEFMANYSETLSTITENGGLLPTLFFGFSASLLGVSGFESSANFVEDQKKGVFRKTLRNMLVGVAIFNPLIGLLVLNTLPMETIVISKDFLLADAALSLGGDMLKMLIVTDAFLVLSGAVLTAFVGVSGLMYRMAADNCLPGLFTKVNKKGANPRIVIFFFVLCSSILVLTGGDLLSLAGVYTISFLGVMTLFAFGNLLLKRSRPRLARTYRAPVIYAVLAGCATAAGIVGNIMIDMNNLIFFLTYFIPALLVVFFYIYQEYSLNFLLSVTRRFKKINEYLYRRFDDAIDGNYLIFVKSAKKLFYALDYLNKNEIGRNLYVVVCQKDLSDKNYQEVKDMLEMIEKSGLYEQYVIKLIHRQADFDPETVAEISHELEIPANRILIGSIKEHHTFSYDELGGVRIIF